MSVRKLLTKSVATMNVPSYLGNAGKLRYWSLWVARRWLAKMPKVKHAVGKLYDVPVPLVSILRRTCYMRYRFCAA